MDSDLSDFDLAWLKGGLAQGAFFDFTFLAGGGTLNPVRDFEGYLIYVLVKAPFSQPRFEEVPTCPLFLLKAPWRKHNSCRRWQRLI